MSEQLRPEKEIAYIYILTIRTWNSSRFINATCYTESSRICARAKLPISWRSERPVTTALRMAFSQRESFLTSVSASLQKPFPVQTGIGLSDLHACSYNSMVAVSLSCYETRTLLDLSPSQTYRIRNNGSGSSADQTQ
jgi:hypothetical protein